MRNGGGRLWVLFALVVLIFGSAAVGAEGPRLDRGELRVNQWVRAFATFAERHPDLTPEQMTFIWSAMDVATPEAFAVRNGAERWARQEGAPIADLVKRSRELFSNDQLGEIFTGMGSLQRFLAEAAATIPYCNCRVINGPCSAPYPAGSVCKTGCMSWTDANGNNWVGICAVHQDVDPDPNP